MGRRTDIDRAEDMDRASDLRREGLSHRAIAALISEERYPRYTISHMQIFNDMLALQKVWIDRALAKRDVLVAEELQKLNAIEEAAWQGWLRSIGEVEKSVEGTMASGRVDYTETKYQAGDSKFLSVMISAHKRRCELLGLDAPVKVAQTDPDGKAVPIAKVIYEVITQPPPELQEAQEVKYVEGSDE